MLFLDELPEFPKQALEALRQPMETGRTTVARAAAHVTYPARFQLVAAMNPCRCGYLGDASRECGRAPRCGEDYQNADQRPGARPHRPRGRGAARLGRRTGPRAGRRAERRRRRAGGAGAADAAGALRARTRPPATPRRTRSDVALQPDAQALAEQAMDRLRLSPRGYTRVLRVARTIADLAGAATVRRVDVAEALAFRHRMPGRAM